MLEIEPTEELENYARKWLAEFSTHTDAPELVGRWLLAFPKEETFSLCKHYLELNCPVHNLYRLIQCASSSDHSDQFKTQISNLLEKNPNEFFWALVFSLKKEYSEMIETLILRYFELNETKKDFYPTSIAYSTKSPKILARILNWCLTIGHQSQYMPETLRHLFHSIPVSAPELSEELIRFSRDWFSKNEDNNKAGVVLQSLLIHSKESSEISLSIKWCLSHKSNKSLWHVLNSILRLNKKRQTLPDEQLLNLTKEYLLSLTPAKRQPVLVDSLLEVDKSMETIRLAKETCIEHPTHYLLIKLLPQYGDETLRKQAQKAISKYMHTSQNELLLALLKSDMDNEESQSIARKWLGKFPDHEQHEEISNLLNY